MKIFHPNNIQPYLVTLYIIISLCLISCQAPRNNPLDPENPSNNLGTITGVVQTFSLPFSGIEGANVYWERDNRLVKTDINGRFNIENIPMENGNLVISKKGYTDDTVFINWNGNNKISPNINLNSMPLLDSVAIFTTVINQFNPSQVFQLNVQATVSDRDNDIDSVMVFNNQLSLNKKLDYNISQNVFQTSLSTSELNVSDLEEVIGLDFSIIVYDRFKNQYDVGSVKVTRVIKSQISIVSPANSDSVGTTPTLTWQRFNPGYPFTYNVEVYTNDLANSQVVIKMNGISSDSTSYFVKNPLPSRDYFWVVWVVDQFQNRARSKPATFTVK